ncbi:MAG TPA: hypothetical protein VL043_09845 [Protaetiibacter sp.]|nr:hypothetical protein [Protaetiibacter sp.]
MATVMTHRGEVDASTLGVTLPHEHFFVNAMEERREVLLHDEVLMTEEARVFVDQGGTAMFELTSSMVAVGALSTHRGRSEGRVSRPVENVEACVRVADAVGLTMVMATGFYREPYLDEVVLNEYSTNELADFIVRDLMEGYPGTEVRAGVIGEVATNKWYVSAMEERSFRAAARAHKRTGRAIYTHAVFWPVAEQQIEILKEEGVDLTKVAIGHTDLVPGPEYAVGLARHGVYIGIDSIQSGNSRAVAQRVAQVTALIRAGYLERILLSHDLCMPAHLTANGGNGFGFVLGGFRDALTEAGVTAEEFDVIVRDNPARFVAY